MVELVEQALAAARVAEENGDWDEYETILRQAATDGAGALSFGLELVGSDDQAERATGCDLLYHASDQDETVRAEAAEALTALAEREADDGVLWSLARAVERTYDPRAVPVLVALAGHPDADVRQRVAVSFVGVLTGLPDGPDVCALITLTRDECPQVRDWATFTLGFQAEVDTREVRSALWERTTDADPDTRAEGIRGLARRHDPRAVPLLRDLLEDPEGADVLTFSAARILGSSELLSALRNYDPDDTGVTEAVHACDPVHRARQDALAWELVCELHRIRPDLRAGVSMARFDAGLSIGVDTGFGPSDYCLEALLSRADGDPVHAAELVAADSDETRRPTSEPLMNMPGRKRR
ncbi:HEAT repeat domain-containing protein [Kitasatospora sp. NPDC048296]|uniref:HEAT repeat domain-containing protein n=1 Tax=Kitasatospora sp. NPDC048296 TaxID=3364048 RepID=UPI0037129A83